MSSAIHVRDFVSKNFKKLPASTNPLTPVIFSEQVSNQEKPHITALQMPGERTLDLCMWFEIFLQTSKIHLMLL